MSDGALAFGQRTPIVNVVTRVWVCEAATPANNRNSNGNGSTNKPCNGNKTYDGNYDYAHYDDNYYHSYSYCNYGVVIVDFCNAACHLSRSE